MNGTSWSIGRQRSLASSKQRHTKGVWSAAVVKIECEKMERDGERPKKEKETYRQTDIDAITHRVIDALGSSVASYSEQPLPDAVIEVCQTILSYEQGCIAVTRSCYYKLERQNYSLIQTKSRKSLDKTARNAERCSPLNVDLSRLSEGSIAACCKSRNRPTHADCVPKKPFLFFEYIYKKWPILMIFVVRN